MKTSTQRKLRFVIAVGAVLLSLGAGTWLTASEELAEKEKQSCTACHDKPGSRMLTDRGVYYQFFATMEGYDEISQDFGRCTTCHVRKPGSDKLTKTGKQFLAMVNDMAGLRVWLEESHPPAPGQEQEQERD